MKIADRIKEIAETEDSRSLARLVERGWTSEAAEVARLYTRVHGAVLEAMQAHARENYPDRSAPALADQHVREIRRAADRAAVKHLPAYVAIRDTVRETQQDVQPAA